MGINLHCGLGLKSDAVRLRRGFGGDEPREIIKRFRGMPVEWKRLAVCLNTWYPEISGGFYLNRYILCEIQSILERHSVHIVSRELFSETSISPVECPGALMENEDYVLVAQNAILGSLCMWAFDAGGASSFYKDACVLDFALMNANLEQLESDLISGLKSQNITVEVIPGSEHAP